MECNTEITIAFFFYVSYTVMEPIESKELRDSLLDAVSELTTVCEYAATRYGAR